MKTPAVAKNVSEALTKASRDSWMTETAGRDILTGKIAEAPRTDSEDIKASSKPKV